MAVFIDVETAPVSLKDLPPENKAYLAEKSKNKRSGKIIDGENYGAGAIGKFELSKIICCCIKKDDEEIINAYIGDEKELIKEVFEQLVGQDHVIGFNHISFDLPMIKMRGLIHGLHTTMPFGIKSWSERYIDVRYQLTGQFGVGNLPYWCRVFSIIPPRWELEDKSNLDKYPIEDVVKGCREDVRATAELYNKLNNQLKENK